MSASVGILDTSAIIALPTLSDASALPETPLITTITLAELSAGPLVTDDAAERARRQSVLQQAESDFDPLPFDAPAARVFGQVASALRRSGRMHKARAYDALIAAIAIANSMPVYTANPDDFSGINGLSVVALRAGSAKD
ncbi:MAG: type II toxin-antitoxin system VapC family toxin [Candidatus Nanopelagicales bacterium]|nr:type II toxin-antitoxin system VapC family toxin [Candidatus Nanopelagicales bacterium]MDZ4249879.1 type II toxin-antitoxin system VapC family toxin [Candidatus Nanopelagicales bacterium]